MPAGRPPNKSRTNSDVSQLDETIVGSRADDSPSTVRSPQHRDSGSSTSTVGDDDSTVRDSDSMDDEGDTTINASSPPILGFDHYDREHKPTPPSFSRSESQSYTGRARNGTRSSNPLPGLGPTALDGTIARATVDTTLAVIPAEAFRKLTRKYPKASGTIVQVVLERFSRVTFMTGASSLIIICSSPRLT